MTVYTLNPLEDPRWAEFLQRHPRASVYHTPGWLEALHRTYGYEPIVYTEKWKCVELRPLSADLTTQTGLTKAQTYYFHKLDLRLTLDKLFSRFHKTSIQQLIGRAEREGLSYEEGKSEKLLQEFYRLLLLTRRRHQLPPQPIDWFRNLIACLGDQLKIRIASKDGRPIASILTLCYQDTLVYKYGCSDASCHNLGAMQSLLWKAIQEAKERGVQEFDLGRSDSDNGGLITFKERWGATRSMLTYVRCHAPRLQSASGGYGMQIAKRVCARMPAPLFSAAGKLLYRHIG